MHFPQWQFAKKWLSFLVARLSSSFAEAWQYHTLLPNPASVPKLQRICRVVHVNALGVSVDIYLESCALRRQTNNVWTTNKIKSFLHEEFNLCNTEVCSKLDLQNERNRRKAANRLFWTSTMTLEKTTTKSKSYGLNVNYLVDMQHQ
jgi:hypothetical protein